MTSTVCGAESRALNSNALLCVTFITNYFSNRVFLVFGCFSHKDIIIKFYKEAQDLTSANQIDMKSHRTGFVSHHLDVVVTHKEEVIIFCSAALDRGEKPGWHMDIRCFFMNKEMGFGHWPRHPTVIFVPWNDHVAPVRFSFLFFNFIVTQWHHFHVGLLCDREKEICRIKLKSIFTLAQQDIILFLLKIVCATNILLVSRYRKGELDSFVTRQYTATALAFNLMQKISRTQCSTWIHVVYIQNTNVTVHIGTAPDTSRLDSAHRTYCLPCKDLLGKNSFARKTYLGVLVTVHRKH